MFLWKEAVEAYEGTIQHLPGTINENHEQRQS
jgi:hypothetical protein